MTFIMSLFALGLVLGLLAVASNPSPFFGAFGLVMVSGIGCGVIAGYGGSFLSLVLFLIYLGGMLVVFAYSAALAAEPYPESLGSGPVIEFMVGYGVMVLFGSWGFWGGWYEFSWSSVDELGELLTVRGDASGIALMYSLGGGLLAVSAWVLVLTLFVVLELTRGFNRGALRSV
nr:NADH dehydrogenase subunit 6 [Sufflamen bursa]